MLTDIEIQRKIKMKPIKEVLDKLGLNDECYDFYGKMIAKIDYTKINKKRNSKLILVTATNPTSLGEGKTTLSIGLADSINRVSKNKQAILALREPSLGPVFGIKGGATGGGYSQVYPMEDINLHFTGDFHAITSANNLLCCLIDNHIFQGNELGINPDKIIFNRCLDLNDRALREIEIKNINKEKNKNRSEKFNITAASEIMACMCLSNDLDDLLVNLGNITVAYNFENKAVFAKDLKANEAMAILLKDAIKPNLVQTLENTPALIHCGPFANIAHGCNSIIATKTALSLGDYVVTEAGFGADLGCQKFLDIKCRKMGIVPDCVVIVTTIRALKLHGEASLDQIKDNSASIESLLKGLTNLGKHIENIKNYYKLNCVVSINKFSNDTEAEINLVKEFCMKYDTKAITTESYALGSEGGIELAKEVMSLCEKPHKFSFGYETSDWIETKIKKIATNVYGATEVIFSDAALASIQKLEENGYSDFDICIAKTQYSLSDDPTKLYIDKPFKITIQDLELRSGAKLIVCIAGSILLMPGLSKVPQATKMTIKNNIIDGLF